MLENFSDKITYYEENLDLKSQSYIHLRSMKNFVLYWDKLTESHKIVAAKYFETYFTALSQNTEYDWNGSNTLYWDYIHPLGVIYRVDLKFKSHKKLSDQIIYGLVIDVFLFVTGISGHLFYLPVGTLFFCLDWYFTKVRHHHHGRVYGPRY